MSERKTPASTPLRRIASMFQRRGGHAFQAFGLRDIAAAMRVFVAEQGDHLGMLEIMLHGEAQAVDRRNMTGHIGAMSRVSLKEQIIVAAVETLHQMGFNGSAVQDITDAAGAPKGSFYNHFKTKEDLAVEALDRYWQRVQSSLSVLSDVSVPPVDRLKFYFRSLNEIAHKRKYQTGCMIGNLSAEMSDQSALIRKRLAVILAAWSRAIEICVREAQADGSMRRDLDAKTIASFLLNAWEGAVMRSKVDKNPAPLEAFEQVAFAGLAA
jgi:TetR/AcrR family transcriptional repressor of nem operon